MWEDLFTDIDHLKGELENARLTGILNLDFEKIDRANQTLGEMLLNNPFKAFGNLEYALESEGIKAHINLTGLAPIHQENIIDLRSRHLGELLSVEGIVLQDTSVHPKLSIGTFQCQKCGAIIKIVQDIENSNVIKEPLECYADQGGCGRVTTFRLLTNLSEYKDFQKILITNPYYEEHRIELKVHCYNEHCGKILPGETITINGQYLINQQKDKLTQETYFLAQGFESSQSKNLEFTAEEKKEAEELSQTDELWNTLIRSFAPTVYGNVILKEALLLQQFGGVWYDQIDGTTKRGSIHILFVGDPGTVKSTLMQASCRIAPIFTKASGRGATIAGITAGGTKDPLGEGWILQAGALVRANSGICYLDEFDKLPKEVQGCLHTPMEQGVVEQSKMGNVNRALPARTAILASMNPKNGRFEDLSDRVSQIDIEAALLSRYDLIFAICDTPNPSEDRKIVTHIHDSLYNSKNEDGEKTAAFLRKYIHHAKQLKPKMSTDVNQEIVEWFIDNRKKKDFHINYRHYEAIRRLSEAAAKARLSTEVNSGDVARAKRLFKHSLGTLGIQDLDAISTGITEKDKYVLRGIKGILPAHWNDILKAGFDEAEVQRLIERGFLMEGKDKRIYCAKECT